ncbi:MAG: hypothetical protein U0136_02650 [Bdellovibrionota bacterium]
MLESDSGSGARVLKAIDVGAAVAICAGCFGVERSDDGGGFAGAVSVTVFREFPLAA